MTVLKSVCDIRAVPLTGVTELEQAQSSCIPLARRQVMALEKAIAKHLVKNLEVLERGLSFLEQETSLFNAHGAAGRMDILARDSSRNWVIIEVKRHDQSARQAVHELFKYVRLLHVNFGVPRDQIRCFIVSTTWHELIVPFSEMQKTSEYEVCGFSITVDSEGRVTSAAGVSPLPEPSAALAFERSQEFYLFVAEDQRRKFLSMLPSALSRFPFVDFAVIVLDHTACRANVFPFGVYIAVSEVDDAQEAKVIDALCDKHPAKGPDRYDDGPWSLVDMILHQLHIAARGTFADKDDGSPSKFINILREWIVRQTMRHGSRLGNPVIYSDIDVHRRVAQIDGANEFSFHFVGSPKHAQSWDRGLRALRGFLGRSHPWFLPLERYLQELAAEHPSATVSVISFDAKNLVQCLHPAFPDSQPPFLELVVEGLPDTITVEGLLEWNGDKLAGDAAALFDHSLNLFASRGRKNHDDWRNHGLRPILLESSGSAPCEVRRLSIENGALSRVPQLAPVQGLQEFVRANQAYIQSLVRLFPVMTLTPKTNPQAALEADAPARLGVAAKSKRRDS